MYIYVIHTTYFHLSAQTIDSLWIGASDILDEGQWIWVSDGSNLTFSLWNDNEPNNAGTGEDCCEIEMGWNDSPCDLTNPYVCKKYVYAILNRVKFIIKR